MFDLLRPEWADSRQGSPLAPLVGRSLAMIPNDQSWSGDKLLVKDKLPLCLHGRFPVRESFRC